MRVELAFDGGQVMSAVVTPASADALEQALGAADVRADAGDAAFALDAEDGRYVIALRRVVYIKRFARDTRVGFGAAAT
ncbi:MAG: hypothetical protein E6G13_01945 [Actinobacteria bacterium]|nr:MAG: hypothetical protein E6G13_01945 [Actinomycetota bacterium]